jgi:hypothetical protein
VLASHTLCTSPGLVSYPRAGPGAGDPDISNFPPLVRLGVFLLTERGLGLTLLGNSFLYAFGMMHGRCVPFFSRGRTEFPSLRKGSWLHNAPRDHFSES